MFGTASITEREIGTGNHQSTTRFNQAITARTVIAQTHGCCHTGSRDEDASKG